MKTLFKLLLLALALKGYGSRPQNSDKYRDSFPSDFRKTQPYEPAEQVSPQFPPPQSPLQPEVPKVLPEQRGTNQVPSGKMKGPLIPPPKQEDQNSNQPVAQNTEVQDELPTYKPELKYDYNSLRNPPRIDHHPTNRVPQPPRPNQGKRPPKPLKPRPMELEHKGELMTHPQPQQNPENSEYIDPFPKYPNMQP